MTITPQQIKHIKKQKQKNRRKRQKVRFLSHKRQILERESESFRERERVCTGEATCGDFFEC